MTNKLLGQNIGRIWASLIIHEFIQNKIYQFYLSPGMRNAPLIAALDHFKVIYPKVNIILCIDERAAAYRALGYSKATGNSAVLICTSGTALANYYPAIIEAKKSNLPLIVISADRPSELTHCDDNQTIDQTKFYGQFIQGELNLGAPSFDISPLALTSSLSNLIHKSHYPQLGPVHFNAPFREPLENTTQEIPNSYRELALIQINKESPSTVYLNLETKLTDESFDVLAKELNQSMDNGILVIGSMSPYENEQEIVNFIKKLNWPTYFDVSSSLKYQFNLNDNTLPTFDHPEVQEALLKSPPKTIFHIGGRLTSKHYYTYLKQVPSINLITLSKNIEKEDPSHHTKFRINADINATLKELSKKILDNSKSKPKSFFINFEAFAHKKINLIDHGPLSFPIISKTIIDNIPDQSILYLGNSTAVRSFDSYFSFNNKKKLSIATNRGVSGIEGFIASSIGFIDGRQQAVYLVLGDISLIHDLNSIYFLKELNIPLKIIIINNFSGGIFTLLPINKEKDVIKYVSSPHNITFEKVAALTETKYLQVNEVSKLKEKFLELVNSNEHIILEIFVKNETNEEMYQQLKTIKL